MRHRPTPTALLLLALAAMLAWLPAARGAGVPTGFQEYHVLGHEQHVYNMFNRPILGQFFVGYALSGGMTSVVSATASSDNQVVYYDHWEDGFEADIFTPAQASTRIFGNADASDGRACDYIPSRACTGVDAVDDIIGRGETLNLASITIPSGNASAPNCAAGGLSACVPIPRNAAQVRFDGGDRLVASGGPVTLVHIQDPTANIPGILGGAVEVLPLQALQGATSYSVPVGQDTFTRFGGTSTAGMPFRFVDLNIVAFEDDTAVQVTSPGAGTVDFVLDRGQHWSSQGAIDLGAGPSLVINEGTKVSVSKPIGGLIFASSTNFYGTRTYALLPDLLHSNDYVITAPGDNNAVNGTSIHDLYIYNPSPTVPISVTATDSVGSNVINIPANRMAAYSVATGRPGVPPGSTVRLTSGSNFWGVTAYGSRNTSFDWGHSWLAVDFLTQVYTIPYAPDNPGRTLSPPAAPATPGSAAAGSMPAFVAATADNTCVRVDFANDGVFDPVRNGAGALVPFSGPPGSACDDGYLIDALQALRIYDNNAADGTLNNDISGARVETSKPVAMAYGIDTDSSPTSGPGLLDLGYAIYPVDQRFLNPVLTVDKRADRSSVPSNLPPGQGTLVTYTLEVQAYEFSPLTAVTVTDLLPAEASAGGCVPATGPGSGYVCNSTTITYPDLSTESGAGAEPGFAVAGARDQLTWNSAVFAPKPAQLLKNETLLIQYRLRIEGGPSAVLRNDAVANAALGASAFFTPSVSANVIRTDVGLAKTATPVGTPEPGALVTYSLTVTNSGVAPESGITVSDPIPAGTTFEPGSVVSAGGFVGGYSAGQNAVVWTAPALAPGASATVSFQARINALTAAGTDIENVATYESNETDTFTSNITSTTVVAPDLGGLVKRIVGDPPSVYPGETITFEVFVPNDGTSPATGVLLSDLVPVNTTYVPGSLRWRPNAAPFSTLTDAADGVEASGADGRAVDTGGSPAADRVELRLASLGVGEDLTFRFQVRVDLGTGGQTVNNSATVQSSNFAADDSSLVQVLIADTTVSGHLFVDVNGDGVQGAGEPDLAGVDVIVTDENGGVQVVSTDADGNYTVVVTASSGGATTVDVDETDPDFPAGATLCTASPAPPDGCVDPQVVTAVGGTNVAARNVGYVPAPIAVLKTSNAGGSVVPGDRITYTIAATNNTGVTQTGIAVQDPLPPGTTYVPQSTAVSIPALIDTLRDDFTVTGNAAGNGNDGTRNWIGAWTEIGENDGFGNGDVEILTDEDSGRLQVQDSDNGGEGAYRTANLSAFRQARLTLLYRRESLDDAADFVTVAVCNAAVSTCGPAAASGTQGWVEVDRFSGAVDDTDDTYQYRSYDLDAAVALSANVRVRFLGSPALGGGDRVFFDNVQIVGTSGAALHEFSDGVNAESYSGSNGTAAFGGPWAEIGENDGPGSGDVRAVDDQADFRLRVQDSDNGGEGLVRALDLQGIGATRALASFFARRDSLDNPADFATFDVSTNGGAFTEVDRFADGDDSDAVYVSHDLSAFIAPDTRLRFLGSPALGGGDRVLFDQVSVFATASTQRSNQAGDPDPLTDGVPPALVVGADGIDLPPGATMTVTFQVDVASPLAPAIASITNTATVSSDQIPGGVADGVTDTVLRLDVGVEPNASATVLFSASAQDASFLHTVTNRGDSTDSYELGATNAPGVAGWALALVDPATGVVIATDADGDGNWDGGSTPNTGSLAPGASRDYVLRVTVPAGAAVGTRNAVTLRATSDLRSAVTGSAVDTVIVADGAVTGAGDVLVQPDNASFVTESASPSSVVYTHTVTNLTGGARAFELQANSSQGYTTRIYRDTNGDGVYTDGVDVAIVQTAALADGAAQRIFVVVDVPPGTPAGTVDVLSVTASFFDDGGTPGDASDDTSFAGTATDTTTVTPAANDGDNAAGFSLSGGGTRVVTPGETAAFPGALSNLGTAADIFEFTLSASAYRDGGPDDDDLPHATQLVLDTNGNGVIDPGDQVVAADLDGDGMWDTVDPAYDEDGDGNPDVAVPGGGAAPFELRRPVDSSQGPYADIVTFTATSKASGISDAVTTTTSVQTPTLAVIGELVAFAGERGVTVQWSTDSEHGTVGFVLERLDERRGRWHRINRRLLPALLHSRFGGVYRLLDPGVRAGAAVTYRLLELEATGAVLEHGPYAVTVDPVAPPAAPGGRGDEPVPGYERVARPLDRIARERVERKVAAHHAAVRARLARRGGVVKVIVDEPGLYRIDAGRIAEVTGAGVDQVRRLIRTHRLRLLGGGRPVATLADGDDALLFYGEAVDSPYTGENVYQLFVGPALRMQRIDAGAPAPAPPGSFTHTARAEGNRYYLTHLFDDPDGDYWMWDFRFEDMLFETNDPVFPVPTPDPAAAGTASVTVRFHGGLEALHRVRVSVEGVTAAVHETEWRGLTPHALSFELDVADLGDGETRLAIEGLGSGDPMRPSTFYVNDIAITYPRLRRALADALETPAAPGTTSIDGFQDDEVAVFDVSRPEHPRLLRRVTLDRTPAGTRVSFRNAGRTTARVLAVSRAALRAPRALVADTPSLLARTEHSVDWLLITSGALVDAARVLADHRRAQGLRTMVVDVEDVYDEFAHGVRDVDAIWRFLRHAHEHWRVAPRYVVLAGEGSFDYKDHLGHGDSIIPTLLAPTADGLFPSDNLFADVAGNDFLPDMAIGRLPVIDAAELTAVSRKIIDYEASSGPWTQRVVLGADPPDDGGDFPASSARVETVIDGAPVALAVDRIVVDPLDLPMAQARAVLHQRLNEGRAFFNFFGHASGGSLGNLAPGLVNAGDLSAGATLDNGAALPVVTAFTCLVGQFATPGVDSVGELLLLAPGRGAAAVFAPSGLSRNRFAEHLGEAFYRATYRDGELVIGDAILRAQADYARRGGDGYLLDIYNLLGDPATVMK